MNNEQRVKVLAALGHASALLELEKKHWTRHAQKMRHYESKVSTVLREKAIEHAKIYETRAAEVAAVLAEIREAIDVMEGE